MKKPLVYMTSTGGYKSVDDLSIEFVPGLCCAHDWAPGMAVGHFRCTKCRASCNRGKDGKIEHYSNSSVDYAVPKLVG